MDLRGYGPSSKPTGLSDHSYKIFYMAQDAISIMSHFELVHELTTLRGTITGSFEYGWLYTMALDHPSRFYFQR